MKPSRKSTPSTNKHISISGDVKDSAVIIGDNNTVNQTFFQKVINIFKSDSETLEHRNRRILLGHVENAWIKGVLDASLHGAALLDLGIKPDPEAVTKYPWAIKRESTDETLPAGTSMLEIFDSIGMGRSLLILGAPGSGKTTMLLELARQLIARAREDVTQPIPMVFNLASWTEKLTLADWLARELNNLYSVPRKTAPDWVKGNKLLLLLDGLDEVRQESRAKCVEAINAFRKEHGLTSLAVCSRSQDYADLSAKLSFEGAIEVQPLTQEQIAEFFNRLGDEMVGIKQVLKKDSALREMAETPLFLNIMIMAYRDNKDIEILVSGDEKAQRKHLFDTYIERMFERPRSNIMTFKKQAVFHWLSWLAHQMIIHNQTYYLHEGMKSSWLSFKTQWTFQLIFKLIIGLFAGLIAGLFSGIITGRIAGLANGLIAGLIFGLAGNRLFIKINKSENFETDSLTKGGARKEVGFPTLILTSIIMFIFSMIFGGLTFGLLFGVLVGLFLGFTRMIIGVIMGVIVGVIMGVIIGISSMANGVLHPNNKNMNSEKYISFSTKTSFSIFLLLESLLIGLLISRLTTTVLTALGFTSLGLTDNLFFGILTLQLTFVLVAGYITLIQHYTLRFILARNNLLPWRLVPFLDHCVDLIFLRRVGGGYIFVHRLLMEHFAEMYVETPTSKGS